MLLIKPMVRTWNNVDYKCLPYYLWFCTVFKDLLLYKMVIGVWFANCHLQCKVLEHSSLSINNSSCYSSPVLNSNLHSTFSQNQRSIAAFQQKSDQNGLLWYIQSRQEIVNQLSQLVQSRCLQFKKGHCQRFSHNGADFFSFSFFFLACTI